MEKFNRAQRRNDNNRIKKKRLFFWSRDKNFMTEKKLGIVLHTPAICSCYMCGNARKWFKEKTIQEISFNQRKLHLE